MISDHDLAVFCAQTYQPGIAWTFAGSTFHAIMTDTPDGLVIAIEGSKSLADWFRDFQVFGYESFNHPDIGPVHAGFNVTTDQCFNAIVAAVAGKPLALTGHSKGGAEAEMLATKLAVKGIWVSKLTTFGTPKWVFPGNKKVAPLLPATLVGTSYRHFKDIVPEEPEIYLHPVTRPLVEIGTGTLLDRLNPGAMHHIEGYIASLPA